MKLLRRLICLVLVAVMLFGLPGVSLAATPSGSINLKVENVSGDRYRVVFNAALDDPKGPSAIDTVWYVDTSVVQLTTQNGTDVTVSSDTHDCFVINSSVTPHDNGGGSTEGFYKIDSASWSGDTCNLKVTTSYDTNNIKSAKDYFYLYFKPKAGKTLYNGCIQVKSGAGTKLSNSNASFTLDTNQYAKTSSWDTKLNSIIFPAGDVSLSVVNSTPVYHTFTVTCTDICGDTISSNGILDWTVSKTDDSAYPGVSINASGYLTVQSSDFEAGTVRITATSKAYPTIKAYKDVTITKATPALATLTMRDNQSISIPDAGFADSTYTFTFEGVDQYGKPFKSFGTPTCTIDGTYTGVSIEGATIKVSNEAAKNTQLSFKVKAKASNVESNEVTISLIKGDTDLAKFNIESENGVNYLYVPETGKEAVTLSFIPKNGKDRYGNDVDKKAFNGMTYKLFLNDSKTEYKGNDIKIVDGVLSVTTEAAKNFSGNVTSFPITVEATSANDKKATFTVTLYIYPSKATVFNISGGSELLTKLKNPNGLNYGVDAIALPTTANQTVEYTAQIEDQYGRAMTGEATKLTWSKTGVTDANVTLSSNGYTATVTVAKNAIQTTSMPHTLSLMYDNIVKAYVEVSIVDMEVAWPETIFKAESFKYGVKYSDVIDSAKATAKAVGQLEGTKYNGKFSIDLIPDDVPVAGELEVVLTFTVTDSGNMKDKTYTKKYTVNIEKADPSTDILTYAVPTNHVYNSETLGIGEVTIKDTLVGKTVFGTIGKPEYYLNDIKTDPVYPGTYSVKVTYTESTKQADNYVTKVITITNNYKIAKANISNDAQVKIELDNVSGLVYNSKEFKPSVRMYLVGKNNHQVDADGNYKVEYEDNINASTKAKVIIRADEDSKYLTGNVTKEFTIGKLDLSDITDVSVSIDEVTYDSTAQRDLIGVLTMGKKTNPWYIYIGDAEDEKTLDELYLKAEFDSVPCDAGEYEVTIKPSDETKCNFSGEVKAKYYINKAVITSIDTSSVNLSKVYDGTGDLPAIPQNQFVLKLGTDKNKALPDNESSTGKTVYVDYTLTGERFTADTFVKNEGTYTAKLEITGLSGTAAANYKFDDSLNLRRDLTYTIAPYPITGAIEIGWDKDNGTAKTYDVGDVIKATDEQLDVPAFIKEEALNAFVSYQWYRNGVLVKNATGETYTIDDDDKNTVITLKKTVSSETRNFSGSVTSNGIAVGKNGLDGEIKVTSDDNVTELFAAFTATGNVKENTDYVLVWLRNGAVIPGASGTKYTVAEEDLGKTIFCRAEPVSSGTMTGTVTSAGVFIPARKVGKPVITFTSIVATTVSFTMDASLYGNDYATYKVEIYEGSGNSKTFLKKIGDDVLAPCTIDGLKEKTLYSLVVTAKGNIKTDEIATTETFTTTLAAAASKIEVNASGNSIIKLAAAEDALDRLIDAGTLVINTTGGYVEMSAEQALKIEVKNLLVEVRSPKCRITLTKGVFDKMKTELSAKSVSSVVKFEITRVTAGNSFVVTYASRGNSCYRFAITINGLESSSFEKTDLIKIAVPAEKDKDGVLGLSGGITSYSKSAAVSDGMLFVNIPAQIFFTVVSKDEQPVMQFNDVKESDWFYDYVVFVFEHGLMQGTGSNFAPLSNTTREQLIQVLYNIEGNPGIMVSGIARARSAFPDLEDSWYTDAVVWAYESGVTSGMTDATGKTIFGVGVNLTREMLVTMLYNYDKGLGKDVTGTADLTVFPDGNKVSSWATPAFKWAVSEGIIGGKKITKDGVSTLMLDPQGLATRAELATILAQYAQ